MIPCPTPRKRRFSTRTVAKAQAIRQGRKWLRVYECSCGYWHLTHRTRRTTPTLED